MTVLDAHPRAQHDLEEVRVKIHTFEYSRQTGRRAGRQIDSRDREVIDDR